MIEISDSLEFIKKLPDKSINLILIDPPYNIKKAEWDNIHNYIEWMTKHFIEFDRILKDNGSFYFFHNDFKQMCRLQIAIEDNTDFIYKNFITIKKPTYIDKLYNNFRTYINSSEYLLFYTKQKDGWLKKEYEDINKFKNLRKYFYKIFKYIGVKSKKDIINIHGQKLDHCFRFGSSQWVLPSKKTYEELTEYYNLENIPEFRTYEDLKNEYKELKTEYRKKSFIKRYTFNKKDGLDNVWKYNFNKGRRTKHKTEKPLSLIKDIISYSSNEGDIILDCFLGSGTTAVACKELNRICWGCDQDDKFIKELLT